MILLTSWASTTAGVRVRSFDGEMLAKTTMVALRRQVEHDGVRAGQVSDVPEPGARGHVRDPQPWTLHARRAHAADMVVLASTFVVAQIMFFGGVAIVVWLDRTRPRPLPRASRERDVWRAGLVVVRRWVRM